MQFNVDDIEKHTNLERTINKATSPSLLVKLDNPDAAEPLLAALSKGGWNVLMTQSEMQYRRLAHEGGFDVVTHDRLGGSGPVELFKGSVHCDFSKLSQNDTTPSIATLDKLFIENTKPNISFDGSLPLFRDFHGEIYDHVSYALSEFIQRGPPGPKTNLIVCDEVNQKGTFGKYKNFDLPVVAITADDDKSSYPYNLRHSDFKNEAIILSTLRRALAEHYANEVKRPKNIVYVQGELDDTVIDWLKKKKHGVKHNVYVLKNYGRNDDLDEVEKLLSGEKSGENERYLEATLPKNTDVVMGDLSPDFLRFVETVRWSQIVSAKYYGMTRYKTNADKLASLLFLLAGGDAFVPWNHKGIGMIDALLNNLKRKPRLPLRSLFDKWDRKVAEVCLAAETDILSGEKRSIYSGINSLFPLVEKAKTGLPAATLAYGLMNVREQRGAFESVVRNRYEILSKGSVSLYELQVHIANFNDDPLRELVQNLRRLVRRTAYPPDYDLFRKSRPEAEGERYLKVFDFLTRVNRRQQHLQEKYLVGLSELVCAKKIGNDRYLLVEVEDHKKYDVLLDYLRQNKDNAEIVKNTLEQAVKQAARMVALSPLSVAEQVDDFAGFWNLRFDKRIHNDIRDGLGVFNLILPEEEFSALKQALAPVWSHLATERLVTGFYSDRWPGNMGREENGELYNLGFRMCYRLPAIIETVTVFQHTDYLPASTLDDRIKNVEQSVRLFFAEMNNVSALFNREIVDKYKASPKQFLLEEITEDIKLWHDFKPSMRTADTPIADPIYISLASRSSLSHAFLYPLPETLFQLAELVQDLPANTAPELIHVKLQEYVGASRALFGEIKSLIVTANRNAGSRKDSLLTAVQSELKKQFGKDKQVISRISGALSILPNNARLENIEEVLEAEFDGKVSKYVGLLENYGKNMQYRQLPYEFEQGDFETALKEKYVPAFFAAMMERGLIAAGALFNTMTDISSYVDCKHESEHPFDPEHIPEYERLLDLAKMSVSNSLHATEICQRLFAGKNAEIVLAAENIAKFDKALYGQVERCYQQIKKS